MSDLLRRLGRETRLDGPAAQRIQRRLRSPRSVDLLRALPGPTPAGEARIRARLASRRDRVPARARWRIGLLAAAAMALLLIRPPAPPAPLSQRIATAGELLRMEPVAGLVLQARGEGDLDGTEPAPELHWQQGHLRLEVDPDHHFDLHIHTREAEVHVVGTVLSVDRDALGTRVEVEHGTVELSCLFDPALDRLTAQQSRTCLPLTAAGLLGRALALQGRAAPNGEILLALDQGLARAKMGGAVESELRYVRLQTLLADGQLDEARFAARAYLQSNSTPRAQEVERILRSLDGVPR